MSRYTRKTLLLEILMIAVGLAFAFPIYVLVNLSVRRAGDTSSPIAPTTSPTLANYADAWNAAGLAGALGNSIAVTAISLVVIILVSSLAAYPLARATARWSRWAFLLFALGLLLPAQLALIPLYQSVRDLGLLGTVWSLVLFYCGLQVPFSVFLYAGFLRAIPAQYEEAAAIDGCGPVRTFFSVVFPLLRPVTGTVAILNAIFIWNDFLTPLLYLSGSPQQTIPVAVFQFVGQYVADWQLVFAGLVISVVPILLVYFLMQKRIIQGFAGGLKG
ncbi:raffinose/stachyose/melibiose transport system permease protein [Thermocatellispora tengchongensis]|uniref:Raffinose/stachyose/melibiose transport system permease protein n=1 Tax=Thermocatellispora tengchongensis TaxID=1073253 RepID=A0A840PDS4_9ACTN|nr:carbohydrate ABC transporter permease [Thermocatellispora tengchongensis]MBB5139564.1 raffinose/stachyose/melibiose transport system permease protein [Thermocatellispora tengchongensis]